jgi:hypothetical protein
LRSIEKEQIPHLQKQLDEVRELKKGMEAAGREKTEGYEKEAGIEKEIASLIWQHRLNLLELGASGMKHQRAISPPTSTDGLETALRRKPLIQARRSANRLRSHSGRAVRDS